MESIAICICTYKRYESLNSLLESLASVNKPDSYRIDIIVVDNDPDGSASKIQYESNKVKYFIETNVGVSFARNRAIKESKKIGVDIIAFLDDDETPDVNWLVNMMSALKNYNADIVAGPVITILPDNLKAFLPFMTRKRHLTGTPIKYWGAGNVLIRAKVFDQVGLFSEAYSVIGGEDTQFSARCSKHGLHMIWSNEAVVTEPTDKTRANPKWLNDRAYNKGRIIVAVERELGISNSKRRTAIALLNVVIGVVGWPVVSIIDRIFTTNYNVAFSISAKKGAGMMKELFGKNKLAP